MQTAETRTRPALAFPGRLRGHASQESQFTLCQAAGKEGLSSPTRSGAASVGMRGSTDGRLVAALKLLKVTLES